MNKRGNVWIWILVIILIIIIIGVVIYFLAGKTGSGIPGVEGSIPKPPALPD